ncbi:MAG: DUF2779 domain-containing protein [Bacteroidetes bacterium]|nr:DUF2779 domain-containing protein [Bacteroidota bacterium]
MSENPVLSKTSFVKFIQCPRAFFLYKNHQELKDPLSKERQATFNRGHQVGELAQKLFPGGIDVSFAHAQKKMESVQKTQQLIAEKYPVIYEASFIFNSVFVAVDILVLHEDKWYAYEVKSSSRISATYVLDASLQYYVISNCIALEDFFLVTINASYVRKDTLDVRDLFKTKSVKADARKNNEYISYHVQQAQQLIKEDRLPHTPIGGHCFAPYPCDFIGTCWKNEPNNNVFEFSGITNKQAKDWYEKGLKTIYYIPEEELNEPIKKMVQAYKNHQEIIDSSALKKFYSKIQYPVAFFDIEMYAPAVPQYKGTSPFEALPFLFSWHYIEHENAQPTHHYFFEEEQLIGNTRLIEKLLLYTEQVSSIVMFDVTQDLKSLNQIVLHAPEYEKAIAEIKNKVIDLKEIFTHLWYYHPQAKGSTSLKKIHESIFTNSVFSSLDINSGLLASYKYGDYLKESDLFTKEELKQQLIAYCKADTQAIYDLFWYILMLLK